MFHAIVDKDGNVASTSGSATQDDFLLVARCQRSKAVIYGDASSFENNEQGSRLDFAKKFKKPKAVENVRNFRVVSKGLVLLIFAHWSPNRRIF